MAKNNQEDLLSLIEDNSPKIKRSKKQKGPKTIVVEDPLRMSGDPLGLIKKENQAKTPPRIKSKDDVVVERYNPDVKEGLTNVDVEQRTIAGLVNTVDKGSTKTIRSIIINNVFTYFNLLIFAIVVLLIWSGASIMQTFSLIIATINTIIGIIQEVNAKKMIDKLSLLSAPTAIVVRDNLEQEIGISDVVIDDILYLTAGKQIIVDAVLREGSIEVNESLLTGESDPIIKKAGDTLYSGSFVISGNAYAQATAIGNDIYIEKLTSQAKKYKKPKSDIFKSLNLIIRVVGIFIIPFGLALYFLAPGAWNDPAHIGINIVKAAGSMLGMIPSGLF
ncbi:MAG: HAD-IC family P-type ATPase, partial [Acholeplasmataceae bacterium]